MQGRDVTLGAWGVEVARALKAAEMLARDGIEARVVNMATIKPIDAELLAACAEETGAIVTAEDHNVYGGGGRAVAGVLARARPPPREMVGLEPSFRGGGASAEAARATCAPPRRA